jgi:uncharacterized membrane protein
MKKKFGNFITFISFSLILLFFISDMSGSPNYYLLIVGVLGFWFGIRIIRKAYAPPPKANRFRMIRRTFSRDKYLEENEENEKN